MEKRGYINLVVLEDSPRAEALQKAWRQYAYEYVNNPADNAGRCSTLSITVEDTHHTFPAVFGTSWGTNDLYDTALGMAQEMHRRFGPNTPPLLASVHYNDSREAHLKTFWSHHEKEHGWWNIRLPNLPRCFGFEPPRFLTRGVYAALKGDRPEAMRFRSRLREEQLDRALPQAQVTPTLPTPRF